MTSPNKAFPGSSIKIAGADATVLEESDLLQLSCGVYGCTSNCCTKSAPIILNPYEISLICRESKLSYEDLLDVVETDRAKGFPLVMLPRDPSCHFWTGRGCRIYQSRPLACRLFPLGRVYDNGRSHIVLPQLNVCSGLAPSPLKTVADYLREQDTSIHIQMADRWIEFVNEIELLPLPDKPVTSVAFHMLVYSPDTPPAVGHTDPTLPLEDRFLLRLATAQEQLPLFLTH
jgi:Fe-S-cluster containining protein